MAAGTVEQRLRALEQEFAERKQRFEPDKPPLNSWVEQVWGVFQDDPLFEEAVQSGREWREAQNTVNAEDADVSA